MILLGSHRLDELNEYQVLDRMRSFISESEVT